MCVRRCVRTVCMCVCACARECDKNDHTAADKFLDFSETRAAQCSRPRGCDPRKRNSKTACRRARKARSATPQRCSNTAAHSQRRSELSLLIYSLCCSCCSDARMRCARRRPGRVSPRVRAALRRAQGPGSRKARVPIRARLPAAGSRRGGVGRALLSGPPPAAGSDRPSRAFRIPAQTRAAS